MHLYKTKIFTILCLGIFILSCSKDEPEVINEEELITRVTLTVNKEGEAEKQVYAWNLDGEKETDIILESNAVYEATISFANASNPNDIEDITAEVIEEADDHYVFFEKGYLSDLTIESSTSDIKDSKGIALNVKTKWTTSTTGSGTVRVYLIHLPTTKAGDARADFGGETDVSVDFSISIQ